MKTPEQILETLFLITIASTGDMPAYRVKLCRVISGVLAWVLDRRDHLVVLGEAQ